MALSYFNFYKFQLDSYEIEMAGAFALSAFCGAARRKREIHNRRMINFGELSTEVMK
jgi:hypothetical protein